MTDDPEIAPLDPVGVEPQQPTLNFRKRLEELGQMALLVFILASAAFLSAITAITMPGKPADEVVIQTPRPGTGAATPRVDVLVSQGPHESAYVMPHFVGMTESDAQRRLDASRLRRKVNYVTAPQWPHATIIDQSPLAGSRLAAASTIDLTVAN